jgi:hypothetical protein
MPYRNADPPLKTHPIEPVKSTFANSRPLGGRDYSEWLNESDFSPAIDPTDPPSKRGASVQQKIPTLRVGHNISQLFTVSQRGKKERRSTPPIDPKTDPKINP